MHYVSDSCEGEADPWRFRRGLQCEETSQTSATGNPSRSESIIKQKNSHFQVIYRWNRMIAFALLSEEIKGICRRNII